MASEAIGRIKCPICASKRARVSVSAKGLCCVTCNACHCQIFARSNYSDTLIRQGMTPESEVQAAETAAPRPPEPAPGMEIAADRRRQPREKVEKVEPAAVEPAAVEAAPESAPVMKKSKWDIY